MRFHMTGRGMVRLYFLKAKEWREVYPIDARDFIASGEASLEKPQPKASRARRKPDPDPTPEPAGASAGGNPDGTSTVLE